MKKLLQEFKEFALRGNVMDLAVGVIIGAAFQAIINSLVNDVISPLIGLFAGRESAVRTIHGAGIEVMEIIDVTPLPHNGCRAPNRRRV